MNNCIFYHYNVREQYATWKEECRKLFPLIGSGRFITAPVITEDGRQVQDPLVLLENNPNNGLVIPTEVTTNDTNNLKKVTDKGVIQWMLTLHQIGL